MSRYIVFATVSLALVMMGISGTSVAVAFPVMMSSFNTSLIVAGWVLGIFQLVSTAAMPLGGKASDVLGAKNTFILCIVLFCIGSFLAAIAPNIYFLIFARFIQAGGGGGLIPSATVIVSSQFPDRRQQAIGLFTSIFPIGQIAGPVIGGWLITAFGWHSVFWFNVPVSLVVMVAAWLLLPRETATERGIDLAGTGLFTASIFSFMIGLSAMGYVGTGLPWAVIAVLFAASAILMVAFVRHEGRVRNPVIDLEILRNRPFLAANMYNFVLGACYIGISSLAPLYAISVYGMTVLASGIILTPKAFGMMFASSVTSLVLVRWGYRRPMLVGTACILFSLVLLGIELPGLSLPGLALGSTALVAAIMTLTGIGMGTTAPAANNACIELMPERVGTISGIRGMFRQTGGAISISAGTLLLNSAPDVARGFSILFFALAAGMVLAVPLIFMQPKSCREPPC